MAGDDVGGNNVMEGDANNSNDMCIILYIQYVPIDEVHLLHCMFCHH